MTVPTPMDFVAGALAAAAAQSGIADPLNWLFTNAPCAIVRVAGPIDLMQGAFTEITFDGTVETNNGLVSGGLVTANEPGVFLTVSALRINPVRGNKELRVSRNGLFDDGDPWGSALNQFGVATPAFSSLLGVSLSVLELGDTHSVGVYVDTPDACQVLDGIVGSLWLRNAS